MAGLYLRDDLEIGSADAGDELLLEGDEARHAMSVARVRVGERIAIGNGRGTHWHGRVVHAVPGELRVVVERRAHTERVAPRIVLVQALAKGDRDERAVQAAVELGVDEVVPWAAARSVSRWDERKAEKGRARWSSIAREAAKQSLRSWSPEIGLLIGTSALAERCGSDAVLVLDPAADESLTAVELAEYTAVERARGAPGAPVAVGGAAAAVASAGAIVVVVGPEGGIAPDELDVLRDAGARMVRLGATVLRTSTAGPAALSVLNAKLGRW